MAVVLALSCGLVGTNAQQPMSRRQGLVPAYEGWEQNADGSFNLVFGYMNRSWEDADVPIGPDNKIEPGNADQGQPTHFLPQRSRFIFRIHVPKDFDKKEVVWTLTSHGKTERAYATLHPAYFLDDGVLMANNAAEIGGRSIGNHAPSLTVENSATRTAKVGEAVVLTAESTDDGLPPPHPGPAASGVPRNTSVSATGLRLAWFVYRGAGTVRFDPPQIETWEDLRVGGNSPWAAGWRTPPVPPNSRWIVRVTFTEPGVYVLRCLAHDGGLSTSKDVTFEVAP